MADIPDNQVAVPFTYFNPKYEYGFPVDGLPRFRTNVVENFKALSSQEASSLFHNFNGIDFEASITTKGVVDEASGGAVEDGQTAAYNGPLTLKNVVSPQERYFGSIVNQDGGATLNESDGFCSIFAFIVDPTQRLNAFFAFNPPINSYEGFKGFGINIFGCTIKGNVSRYGGSFHQTIDLANWDVQPNFGYYRVFDRKTEKYITVNSWDGSYQTYLAGEPYDHPSLKPDVVATIERTRKVLTDPSGARIAFQQTVCTEQVTSKLPKYDRETDKVIGAYKLGPPKANFSFNGGGRFFKYVG